VPGQPATTDVRITTPSGRSLSGALAIPQADGTHPGMVVLHEAYGLNQDIRRIVSRFASEGYVALAPDLYSGGGQRALCMVRVMRDLATRTHGGAFVDIDAARRTLAERPDVDGAHIGVVGFCMGGGFALAYGARGKVGAAGVNYGIVPNDRSQLEGVCPVVASYGELDRTLRSAPGRLEAHLRALGVPHDVKVYEGVGHSFLSYDNAPEWMTRIPMPDPMHLGYDESVAEDAWRRMLAFFGEHLGQPGSTSPGSSGATLGQP
jgi:carboxymethylenebutenolidase